MAELKLQYKKGLLEAGCDEAGRGCLAGPVCAAAVILPKKFELVGLTDSKKVSEKQRKIFREAIINQAVAYGVSLVHHEEIDEINILQASILAMHRALDQMNIRPEHISVDGNKFISYQEIPHTAIVKGDGKYLNIAAASILAKTTRDDYMEKMDERFPGYGWSQNKGYPTKNHRMAIEKLGITPIHRKSFRLTNDSLKFNF